MSDSGIRPVVVMRALPAGRLRLARMYTSCDARIPGFGIPGGVMREKP